jgi:hypothetical protein
MYNNKLEHDQIKKRTWKTLNKSFLNVFLKYQMTFQLHFYYATFFDCIRFQR